MSILSELVVPNCSYTCTCTCTSVAIIQNLLLLKYLIYGAIMGCMYLLPGSVRIFSYCVICVAMEVTLIFRLTPGPSILMVQRYVNVCDLIDYSTYMCCLKCYLCIRCGKYIFHVIR